MQMYLFVWTNTIDFVSKANNKKRIKNEPYVVTELLLHIHNMYICTCNTWILNEMVVERDAWYIVEKLGSSETTKVQCAEYGLRSYNIILLLFIIIADDV